MKLTKENVIKYYIEENLTGAECFKLFDISPSRFYKKLKEWNIKKSKDAHMANIRKIKLERYGDENYNNAEQTRVTNIERYGVDNQFKRKELHPQFKEKRIEKYGYYLSQKSFKGDRDAN